MKIRVAVGFLFFSISAALSACMTESAGDASTDVEDDAEEEAYSTARRICAMPLVTGSCRGYFEMWGYDPRARQCVQFIYGGCGGNANRFESEEMCERVCGRPW
jgi:hypothetical protein